MLCINAPFQIMQTKNLHLWCINMDINVMDVKEGGNYWQFLKDCYNLSDIQVKKCLNYMIKQNSYFH